MVVLFLINYRFENKALKLQKSLFFLNIYDSDTNLQTLRLKHSRVNNTEWDFFKNTQK